MARPGVHHIDLVVSSLERSLAFYRDLLGPLGYTRLGTIVGERGETVWYLGGSGGAAIGVREAQSEGEFDRYATGLHHVAFTASSREQVEERADWLRAAGATLESEPKEYDYIPATSPCSSTTPTDSSSRSSTSRTRRTRPDGTPGSDPGAFSVPVPSDQVGAGSKRSFAALAGIRVG